MNQVPLAHKGDITVSSLYPEFSRAEQAEAEEVLTRYLELLLRMYERIQNDPAELARLRTLTNPDGTLRSCTGRNYQPPNPSSE